MAQDYIVKLQGQDNLSSTIKNVKDELKSTGETATQLDKIQTKFEKIQSSTAPLKRQLRDLQAIMAQMNMDGLTNTDQFTQIAQYAGQVKDAMGDAQQAISKYSSDTANLDAVASAFQGISGGISVATGAMNLFGVESENVQQAILKVQSAMALLNGVQAIANTLNKDSALMLKLKAIGLVANTATQTANTAAETVNTAATVANTAATGTNAAGKTAQAAATVTNTAATNAATTAQLANNAAVLANPYVLAAAAVAALTAGIVIWISSMDDSTDSQIALNAAIDAFNEAADSEMQKCAESINLFNKLKKTYDDSGTKIDEFSKKLINNKEVQKKLGVTVKTVDDVHKLFANNTQAYQRAAIARASAMAAEAAQAAMLGSTLSQLSTVYAKLQAGQEVNWRDMRKIVEAAGYSSNKAEELMKSAGFRYITDGMGYGNVATTGGDIQKLFENITKGGAIQKLAEMGEAFKQTFSAIDEIDFKGMLKNNFAALPDEVEKSATTAAKKGHEAVKKETKATGNEIKKVLDQTDNDIKKVLSSLEGCDAIIQQAQKEMKGLDKNSADYATNVEKLKNAIFAARVAKLAIIDDSTLSGLAETRNVIQQIINDLQDPKEIEKFQNKLNEVNEKAYQFALNMANSGSVESLKKVQSALDAIINGLPEGSPELQKWVTLWIEVTKKITDANKKIDDLKKGIEEGSVKKLQDEIKELQDQLTNKNLDVNARLQINKDITTLQKQIDTLTKGQVTIEAKVTPSYIVKGSDDDKRQSYQNAQSIINQINDDFNNGIIKSREQAQAQIAAVNEELQKLGLKPIQIHIATDFEKTMEQMAEGYSSINSLASAIGETFTSMGAESAAAVMQMVATTAQGIAEVIPQIMALIGAKQGEALASGTASAAALPFPANIAAIAMVTATLISTFAQIASAINQYKDGGIVGGSSFYGDKVLARLNSGEMVLNKHQQANLFKAIDNGMFGYGTTENATISFKLKGSDIYGSLKNFTNIKSKSSSIKGF